MDFNYDMGGGIRYDSDEYMENIANVDGGPGSGKPPGYGGGKKKPTTSGKGKGKGKGKSTSSSSSSTSGKGKGKGKSSKSTTISDINDMTKGRGSGKSYNENEAKAITDFVSKQPVGTVFESHEDRGYVAQYEKIGDNSWKMSGTDATFGDSTIAKSMYGGKYFNPSSVTYEFVSKNKAMSTEELKEKELAAVNGKLNQMLGIK